MKHAWYLKVDIAAAGFPVTSRYAFGGRKMFLHLDQVDPVVHFANSASVKHEATFETDILCGIAPP